MSDNDQRPRGPLNPTALTVEETSLVLTKSGGQAITESMIRGDVADGAPTNADGTLNLVHYAAWLVKNVMVPFISTEQCQPSVSSRPRQNIILLAVRSSSHIQANTVKSPAVKSNWVAPVAISSQSGVVGSKSRYGIPLAARVAHAGGPLRAAGT